MDRVRITVQSAGPAGVHRPSEDRVRVSGPAVVVTWPKFMLAAPKPAGPKE